MKKLFCFSKAFYTHPSVEQTQPAFSPENKAASKKQLSPEAITRFTSSKMRDFMASDAFKPHKEAYVATVDNVARFARTHTHELKQPMSERRIIQIEQQFASFKDHLTNDAYDYFSDHKPIVHGAGKELLATFEKLLQTEKIPLKRKMNAIADMAPSMPMCMGGVITAVQTGVVNLQSSAKGLKSTLVLKKIQVVDKSILEFVRAKHWYAVGNEVHFVNAHINAVAEEFGLLKRIDPLTTITDEQISEEDFNMCRQQILSALKPLPIAALLASDYLDKLQNALMDAGIDANVSFSNAALKKAMETIQTLKQNVLDQEFGPVPDHCFLIASDDQHEGSSKYHLNKSTASLKRHFITSMYDEGVAEGCNGIKFWQNKKNSEALWMLDHFIWRERDGEISEVSLEEIERTDPQEIAETLNEELSGYCGDQAKMLMVVGTEAMDGASRYHRTLSRDWADKFIHALHTMESESNFHKHKFFTYAAYYGHLNLLGAMLDAGMNVNEKDEQNCSALSFATESWKVDAIKYLIDAGANINAKNQYGNTALMYAVLNLDSPMAEYLIKKRIDVNAKNVTGTTALMHAAMTGSSELFQCLATSCTAADLDIQNNDDDSAIMYAAEHGHVNIVQKLIELGADINLKNRSGDTALAIAVLYDRFDVVQCLAKSKAELDTQDFAGNTALIDAAELGQLKTVKFLVEQGAEIATANNKGHSAAAIALKNGRRDIAQYLSTINSCRTLKRTPELFIRTEGL